MNNYADILIPKTIAYTAGLINYFFRGKMGIVPKFSDYDADNKQFRKITIDATNESKWIDVYPNLCQAARLSLLIRYKIPAE